MKYLLTSTLALLCLLLSVPASAQVPVLECAHPDFDALESFFFATGGEGWDRADGWMTTCDPCSWYGIRCDANDRVTSIGLADNGLVGNLPPALGDLPFLTTFSAPNNALTGNIPTEIFSLEISDLYLSNNQLSGVLPADFGDLIYLQYLRLDGNNFTGELPASMENLGKLRQLYLNGNGFSGNFPAGLGGNANLTVLFAQNNNLTGCLPEDLRGDCGSNNFKFEGNNGLPWSGDFDQFCTTSLVDEQIGAPCDDGDPDTFDDTINENCDCGPQPDGLTNDGADDTAENQIGNGDEGSSSVGNSANLNAPTQGIITLLAREMTVYPNPTSGNQLTISLPGNEGAAALRLLSVTGSVMAERTFNGPSVQLELPQVDAGLYLVEAVADGVRTLRRVIVE